MAWPRGFLGMARRVPSATGRGVEIRTRIVGGFCQRAGETLLFASTCSSFHSSHGQRRNRFQAAHNCCPCSFVLLPQPQPPPLQNNGAATSAGADQASRGGFAAKAGPPQGVGNQRRRLWMAWRSDVEGRLWEVFYIILYTIDMLGLEAQAWVATPVFHSRGLGWDVCTVAASHA